VFAIDIAAYAIMSNHYHLVLKVDRERGQKWSVDEVIARWYRLYKGNVLVDRYLKGGITKGAELAKVEEFAQLWRARLFDISWLMKNLNEFIAKQANKEDHCTGRYWEGRYKSQALLDETALLSCLMYVDLNPIRAGVNETLPTSDFTSIQERIKQYVAYTKHNSKIKKTSEHTIPEQPPSLLPFGSISNKSSIAFSLVDYLELADWSGRAVHPNKAGFINREQPRLLTQMGIDEEFWVEAIKNFRRRYGSFAGGEHALRQCANDHKRCWHKGVG
jgi:hypothetical protein